MIITFCGHSKIMFSEKERNKLSILLENQLIKNSYCTFYLGGYGDFDNLCLDLLKKLKLSYPHIKLVFITPYLDDNYKKLKYAKESFDEIIFLPLEDVPKKYAILRRNEWMVEHADFLIAYVRYNWGGASKMLAHAKKKKKRYINLAE